MEENFEDAVIPKCIASDQLRVQHVSNDNLSSMNSMHQEENESMGKNIRQAVNTSRRFHMTYAMKMPHDFSFLNLNTSYQRMCVGSDDKENCCARVLFLGILPGKRENELLYIDVPHKPNAYLIDQAVDWKPVVSMFQGSCAPSYSREEELLRERKRLGIHGISSYEISSDGSRLLFPAGGDLFYMDTDQLGMSNPIVPEHVPFNHDGVKIDYKMSLTDCKLAAYIMNNDIWVKHFTSGDEKRLTFANKDHKDIEKEPISAGVTSYVIQEEFDRYTGFWWQPNAPKNVHRILYEEVDESEVQILHIYSPMSESSIDSYRYPRAGTSNAKVQLKIVQFHLSEEGLIEDSIIKSLPVRLKALFPWMEYIVRVDWLSSGEGICVQILDRLQQRIAVIYVPLYLFSNIERSAASDNMTVSDNAIGANYNALKGIKVLLDETNSVWINVSDVYYFYKHTFGSDEIKFVWSSERTGHRHLYRIKCKLSQISRETCSSTDEFLQCSSVCQTLTAGNWDVMEHNDAKNDRQMWVREDTDQVFFVGLKDTVLESHLYMANPIDPANPERLTQLGRSHIISMDKDCSMFITLSSSTSDMFSAHLYRLSQQHSRPMIFMNLLEAKSLISEYSIPEIFSYQSKSGFQMHGMIHRPYAAEPGEKYPTVVYVYGGPRVQMVTNSFKGLRYGRIFTYTLLGYAVLTIDGRGSTHRGLKFEGAVKNRLGHLEIDDQVEGLLKAGDLFDFIDLQRVAIHGWSYGGYLSLMGLAKRPDIFKLAICGAPVTSWELYDTGYTERYMETPQTNPDGYEKSSILKSAVKFPVQPNRLFLFQGVIDENVHFIHTAQLINALIRYCKPYHLQIYPSERHGLRSAEGNEHYETMVLMYLQQYL